MNQRVRLTRELLRQAVLRQLEQTSIEHISVVALCRDADINRSTFYRYYNTPADVVQDIEQGILSDIQKIMAQIDPSSEATYLRQMDAVYEYLFRNVRTIRLLLQNMDFGLQLLENTMRSTGLMERQARRMDETDRRMAATFLLHGGYSLIREWLMAEEPIPPKEFSLRIRNVLRCVYI